MNTANTVVVGCKLPHGLTFTTPDGRKVTLNGMNTAVIAGGHGITRVNENDAAIFFATHKTFAPVVSKAIFYNDSDKVEDLAAMAVELKNEKTGFEGLDPTAPAPGLEIVEGQATDDAKITKPAGRATGGNGGSGRKGRK